MSDLVALPLFLLFPALATVAWLLDRLKKS